MKRFVILVALVLVVACVWEPKEESKSERQVQHAQEDTLATVELRPDGYSTINKPDWHYFLEVPTIPSYYYQWYDIVDDDPDDDTTYIYATGCPNGDTPVCCDLTIANVPSDLLETTELRLRVRFRYKPIDWAYGEYGRYELWTRDPTVVQVSKNVVFAPVFYDWQYVEYTIPLVLNKQQMNTLEWVWWVDSGSPLAHIEWAISEVRLEVDYVAQPPTGILNNQFNRKTFGWIRKFN
jgi:hypothetical protein